MNIPFFEILILLFFLWPLIQRFLEKNKPVDSEQDEYLDGEYDGPVNRENQQGDPGWQEAMRELEMIFTGERPPEPQKPEPPTPVEEPKVQRQTSSRWDSGPIRHDRLNPNAVNTRRLGKDPVASQRATHDDEILQDFRPDELVDELTASENPIYQSLEIAPEIKEEESLQDYSVYGDIRDPKKLREFYVMKEILDKPVSRRRVRNFV